MTEKRKKKVIIGICPECKVRDGDESKKNLYKCQYCGRYFCEKHLSPRLSVLKDYIDKISDPILREKLYEEWRRPDGHPDWIWTQEYFNQLKIKEEEERRKFFEFLDRGKKISMSEERPVSLSSSTDISKSSVEVHKEVEATPPKSFQKKKQRSSVYSFKKFIAVILIILAIVVFLFLYFSGYIKTQEIGKETKKVSYIKNISTTSSSSTNINSKWNNWIDNFIKIVNTYRLEKPLRHCSWLNDLARARFNTMIKNPMIYLYEYDSDKQKYIGLYDESYLISSENVFYPGGQSVNDYVHVLINKAPLKWEWLTDMKFTYYGYFIGEGPAYVINENCRVMEVSEKYTNVLSYFKSYGCNVSLKNTTWVVIELSSWCDESPVEVTIKKNEWNRLTESYIMYNAFRANLPTKDKTVLLKLNISSEKPINFFVLTLDQFKYFSTLDNQEKYDFNGPAYYYEENRKIFNLELPVDAYELNRSGYYFIFIPIKTSPRPIFDWGFNVYFNFSVIYNPKIPEIR